MHVFFDGFEFDVERRVLLEEGKPLHLSPKAFRLLEVLVENNPRALSKQELNDAVWPDTYVEESNLASMIAELRTALGDSARTPRFIRTIHGFGYAFCCEIRPAASRARAGTLFYDGEQIPLFEGPNILGRDASAGILIDHSTVSRRHACITIEGEHATLEDLSSKNGTFIDGRQLNAPSVLDDGSTFVLGDARLTFRRSEIGSTVTIAR